MLKSYQVAEKQKEINRYMLMLAAVSFAVFLCNYQGVVRSYNSTMLALSYRYGFTSRALLGTIYHLINAILPIDMMQYSMTMRFAQITTGLFFLFLLWFARKCLLLCKEDLLKPAEWLLLFFMLFVVSTFSCGYNFFRVDLFMVAVSILAAVLLAVERAEWLVVPLSAIGVMFHQGYVFMYFNIILVLLLCKAVSEDKKRTVKYGILFVLSFVLGSALFLWFEFFSRSNGGDYIELIVNEARNLSLNGGYHTTLLAHEVLGIDLSESEEGLHKINLVQLPFFTLVCMPYIVITVRFFVDLIKNASRKWNRWKYIFVAIGAGTMLPDFLLKIDYGRWVLAVMVYYVVVILALLVLGDAGVEQALYNSYLRIRKVPAAFLLLIVPVILIPLWDIDINGFLQHFGVWFDSKFLHWYEF